MCERACPCVLILREVEVCAVCVSVCVQICESAVAGTAAAAGAGGWAWMRLGWGGGMAAGREDPDTVQILCKGLLKP